MIRVLSVMTLAIAAYYTFHSIDSKKNNLLKEASHREGELSLGPRVRVSPVTKTKGERTISLIGETHPYASVVLYAKLSGYLKEVLVDKGDQVKKDQVLAKIESPELAQEILAAQSDAQNKQAIARRVLSLRRKQLASPQENQQAQSDAAIAQAKLKSLMIQESYATIRAPFDGVVSFRYADPGALVQNATNSQTSALPLFTVSKVDHLKVYVYLDQPDAHYVKIGTPVKISLAERPEVSFEAKVARVAGELDSKTRMLLTEIEMDNRKYEIVSGSFVQVSLKIQTPIYLEMPVAALVMQKDQTYAAVVSDTGVLNYREIKIKDNDGKKISILSGVKEGEMLALNLGNSLIAGTRVQAILPTPETAPRGLASDSKHETAPLKLANPPSVSKSPH